MNYNPTTIQTNLLNVVGFEQPLNPAFPQLSTSLTTASSGIYVNDGSIPYLTLENIKDFSINYNNYDFQEYNSATTYIVDNRIKYTYPTWLIGSTYAAGERVVLNSVGYESLENANIGNTPDENFDKWKVLDKNYSIYDAITNVAPNLNKQPDIFPLFWNEIELFNVFLENKLKAAISNVVNKCTENRNKILEQKRIYYGIGDGSKTITNNSKLTGIKIDFIKNENVKMKINKIGLHFADAESNLTFHVINQNTEQTTFTASCTSNDFIWVDVTSLEINTDQSGSWFIYYDQDDLTYEAINNELNIPTNISNFVKFNNFETTTGTDFKTINESDYIYNKSVIANIDYSILPDLTKWITYNKNIFAEAIKYQFAMDMFKMFLTNANVRANRSERNISIDDIKANVYTTDTETLKSELDKKINDLRDSIGKAKIDNINLPTTGYLYTQITDL